MTFSSDLISARVRPPHAYTTATPNPTQPPHTTRNWPSPRSTTARLLPLRRIAANPSWIINMINTSAPASQKVVRYTTAPGPFSLRSGVSRASMMFKTSRSAHRPAFHRPSIAEVQPSAITLPASPARYLNGLTDRRDPRLTPSAASTQVRQPARMLSSLPGQVDGAVPVGRRGRSSTGRCATASVRSSRTPSGPRR